jgi:hypothetical protein
MATGEHLGQCPACGGHRWWDNRSRKATGEMTRAEPDYVCTECRYGRWNDGRHQAGRATTRRTPPVTTVVLPAVGPGSQPGQRGTTCAALKRDGTPCRNGPMAGSQFCGPHAAGVGGAPTAPAKQCRGTTKAGKPCRAGPVRGSEYCPQHDPHR